MRRLTEDMQTNERGAITVMVAILMVVLLGSAAIAVDVGVIYSERAQLQSGADAAAVALAQKCAGNAADPLCSTTSTLARDLANQNALDGMSKVYNIQLDKTAQKVSVTTSAKEPGGTDNSVSLFFAGALGVPTKEVGTKASAEWGSPLKGPTAFPITVSVCQVRGQTGVMQLLQLHGKLKNPGCNYGPSGAPVPGGFGGLKQDAGSCGAIIDVAKATAGGDTGSNPPPNCEALLNGWGADITAGKEVILLLPVFNAVTGTGAGAVYGLTTFAAFKVAGWKFSGGSTLPYTFRNRAPDVPAALECREATQCKGIIGTFVKYVSLASGYTLGPVHADGATIARLTL
ncbi:UNVERIFIED_ORG: hypothetical protein ABIB19_000707 [Arthrobacter sp. UYEF10]